MYRKSIYRKRYERKAAKCAAMRAAKERKRLAFDPDREQWRCVRTVLLRVWAGPDGRSVALYADGRPVRCGSERAVRGALAQMLYGKKEISHE